MWICTSCGKLFNALKEDGTFSFICPSCKSDLTRPVNGKTSKLE